MVHRTQSCVASRMLVVFLSGVAISRESDAADPVMLNIDSRQEELVLIWPVSVERYYVESTQVLPSGWVFRAEPIVDVNGFNQLRILQLADTEFYRLRAPLIYSDVAAGGALYDSWWAVTGQPAPEGDHPLWAQRPDQSSNTRTGAITWRCKECHGWDYKGVDGAYATGSHRTGIGGIFGTRKTAPEIFELLEKGHSYGVAGLTSAEIWNLAKFVLDGQIDTTEIIDANRDFIGNSGMGEELYNHGIGTNESCANCHGIDGLATPPGSAGFDAYPGVVATENPWEFQHKVRFGQPGTRMMGTASGGGTLEEVADLAAYVQTLPKEEPEASVAIGGLLYDNWWAVTEDPEPESNHPLWALRPDQASNTRSGSVTWRCKECHGWDYKGVNGAYATGSHRTGIGGIFGSKKSAEEIFELIKDDHGYADEGLSDQNIAHLVEFVLEGQIDTAAIIDPDGNFSGNSGKGMELYLNGLGSNSGCAECHGELGLALPPGSLAFEAYPGLLSKENPWEFQHKVRFGQPGTEMPGAVSSGGSLQDVAGISAYAQTLPEEL